MVRLKQVYQRRYENRRSSKPKLDFLKIKYGEKRFSIWRMELLHPAMWHDHDIDFARWLHPAMWHVALESWILTPKYKWRFSEKLSYGVFTKCNLALHHPVLAEIFCHRRTIGSNFRRLLGISEIKFPHSAYICCPRFPLPLGADGGPRKLGGGG